MKFNTSGFNTKQIDSPVYRNSIGLEIALNYTEEEYYAQRKNPLSDLAFSSTYAILCECIGNYSIIDNNHIVDLHIYVQETEDDIKTDITNHFRVNLYYEDELLEIETYLNRRENNYYFNLEFVEFQNLPSTIVLTVEIILDDTTTFTKQTELIEFIDSV